MRRINLSTLFAAGAMILAAAALAVGLGGVASAGSGGHRIIVRSKTVPGATDQIQDNGSFDFVRAQKRCKADEIALSANAFFSQPAINPVAGNYRADVNEMQRFRQGRRTGYLAFGATDYDRNQVDVDFTLQVVCQKK